MRSFKKSKIQLQFAKHLLDKKHSLSDNNKPPPLHKYNNKPSPLLIYNNKPTPLQIVYNNKPTQLNVYKTKAVNSTFLEQLEINENSNNPKASNKRTK